MFASVPLRRNLPRHGSYLLDLVPKMKAEASRLASFQFGIAVVFIEYMSFGGEDASTTIEDERELISPCLRAAVRKNTIQLIWRVAGPKHIVTSTAATVK